MENAFKPAWWLPHPHLQTLWASMMHRNKAIEIQWERLELPDGDFLDLAWSANNDLGNNIKKSPIILMLNGLTGNIKSHYIQRILRLLTAKQYRCVVLQYRGTNNVPNRLPRAYHSGETGDLRYVVAHIKQREPHTPIIAIGYSIGGNILLKWLGETGETNPLLAAAAVSIPFELGKCSDTLSLGFSRVYQWSLLRELCRAYQIKFQNSNFKNLYFDVKKLKTLRDFDENITAPLHGFNNADDYYTKCSSRQYLRNIQIPSLIIHSNDDPFTPRESIPKPTEISPRVSYILTERGGHLGFISGKFPWKSEYWVDSMLLQYIQQQIEMKK